MEMDQHHPVCAYLVASQFLFSSRIHPSSADRRLPLSNTQPLISFEPASIGSNVGSLWFARTGLAKMGWEAQRQDYVPEHEILSDRNHDKPMRIHPTAAIPAVPKRGVAF